MPVGLECGKAISEELGGIPAVIDCIEFRLDCVHAQRKQSLLERLGDEEKAAHGLEFAILYASFCVLSPLEKDVGLCLGMVQAQ